MSTFQEFIERSEDIDGVRFNWNVWPMSSVELEKIVLTLGCLYTPLKESQSYQLPDIQYDPLTCARQSCRAIINPYCQVDYTSRMWICNFCMNRNQFPANYQHMMSDQTKPAELIYTTLDYTLLRMPVPTPPVFLYVIDTCIDEEELSALKEALLSSLTLLPSNARVCLITFNRIVYLWELDAKHLKSYIFSGQKDYTPKQIQEWLGISSALGGPAAQPIPNNVPMPNANAPLAPQYSNGNYYPQQQQPPLQQPYRQPTPSAMGMPPNANYSQAPSGYAPTMGGEPARAPLPVGGPIIKNNIHKFIKPVSQVEAVINDITNQLNRDSWRVPAGRRPLRATGAALSIATSLLETSYPKCSARIMLFVGGPCTFGPGMIIDDDLKDTIRSHHDIEKENAKYMKKAIKHYQALADRAASNGHAIDIFSCALDQTGLHEMKCCTNMTGGLMLMGDSFASNLFKTSFHRVFSVNKNKNLRMAFNAHLEVKTSRELKVSGAIGSCISTKKRNQYVADREDGIGGTSEWKFCSLIPSTTVALYFYVVQSSAPTSQAQGQRGYIQFITNYQGSDGFKHLRVTTIARSFGADDFAFDEESASVLIARMACYKSEHESSGQDVLRWLDRSLIRVCQKFGEYHKGSPESFQLKASFTLFPQFMFHLRRSQFIQVFNNSPDETSFYRHTLFREGCVNSLLMIQPTLVAYSFNEPTQPVMLDTSSIQPDRILLMDTFFQIVIFHGETIAYWRKQGYQDQEDYAAFKQMLEAPKKDANELMMSRFPLPRYVICDQNHSQARFLLSKVNPSVTHNSMAMGYYSDPAQAPVLSDDVSLQVFMDHLKRLAVENAN